MIKTIIFDIDGTLYDYDKAHEAGIEALIAYSEKNLGLSRDIFISKMLNAQNKIQEYLGDVAAIHNRIIRFQKILEDAGLPLYPHALSMYDTYWNTFLDSMTPSAGIREVLELYKERGVRLGIGTDMTARMQFLKLTRLDLLPYIDFVVTSEEAGVEKPHPGFFEYCVKKTGCERQECLFIGDNRKKDIFGALDAGLRAVWFCPSDPPSEADVPWITDMRQLLQMI